MTINLIHNEIVIYEPWYEDIVSMAIVGQTALICIVLGIFTYVA